MAISEGMTIYNATTQKATLLDALANCDELDIDLSQAGEMDTAGFQILLLTKREALKANKTVRLTAHSKAVTELSTCTTWQVTSAIRWFYRLSSVQRKYKKEQVNIQKERKTGRKLWTQFNKHT